MSTSTWNWRQINEWRTSCNFFLRPCPGRQSFGNIKIQNPIHAMNLMGWVGFLIILIILIAIKTWQLMENGEKKRSSSSLKSMGRETSRVGFFQVRTGFDLVELNMKIHTRSKIYLSVYLLIREATKVVPFFHQPLIDWRVSFSSIVSIEAMQCQRLILTKVREKNVSIHFKGVSFFEFN